MLKGASRPCGTTTVEPALATRMGRNPQRIVRHTRATFRSRHLAARGAIGNHPPIHSFNFSSDQRGTSLLKDASLDAVRE